MNWKESAGTSCLGLVSLLAMSACAFVSAEADQLPTAEAREELAYSIGQQAYVYGFPIVEMSRVRYRRTADPANKDRRPLNTFSHRRRLSDHTDAVVVAPNNDTLYSSAWLDLSNGPVLLQVPPTNGRYYAFQFIDFYTNNIAVIGQRTHGTHGLCVAIAGPDWSGRVDEGVVRVDSPTNTVWMIGRILVDGPEDLPNVHALQEQLSLSSLRGADNTNSAAPVRSGSRTASYDSADVLDFFSILNDGLRENPPPASEEPLMRLFDQVGIGLGKAFAAEELDPATARGLRQGIEAGKEAIEKAVFEGRQFAGGWALPPKGIGNFGSDYLFRAVVAARGLGALPAEEAVYFTTGADHEQRALHGGHKYLFKLEKDQLPPVKGFWSLTMYNLPSRRLVENPLGRYAIGDRTHGLKPGPDGSITIYIQREPPGGDKNSNWLPTPEGAFELVLRAYVPAGDFYSASWQPPALVRVD